MMLRRFRYLHPEGDQGGAPAPSPAPSPVDAPAPGPVPEPGPGDSLLKAPNGAPSPSSQPGDDSAWLPEKFRVVGADGKVDMLASGKKLGESYANLERRVGTTSGAVPDSADAYAFTPPEQFKDLRLDDEMSVAFRADAHRLGLSQEQYSMVMDHYFKAVPGVLDSVMRLSANEARVELGKVWTTPADMDRNLTDAQRAVDSLPVELQRDLWTRFGRDPAFIQAAAAWGKNYREDSAPVAAPAYGGAQTAEQMMLHPAYSDPKHPEHKQISERVQAAFQRMGGR